MKFSLVHPSRGRVGRAEGAIREWTMGRSGTHEYEHILSVDADDDLVAYRAMAHRHGVTVTVNANRTMVEATNAGAALATGDVVIVVSDDFGCPPGWDLAVAGAIGTRARAAVLVHDGVEGRIMTLPILTRALVRELGYVYWPAYTSMFADDDLTATVEQRGVLIDARHLLFPHRHYLAGHSEPDATYERQNHPRAWWHGWRVFQKRRIDAFGARHRTWHIRLAQLRIDAYYFTRTGLAALRRRWLTWLGPAGLAAEGRLRAAAHRWLRRVFAGDGRGV